MTDQNDDENTDADSSEDTTAEDVQRAVQAGQQGVGAVQAATQGNATGALSGAVGAAGTVAGAVGGEGGQAVQTGANVAGAGISAVGAAASGNAAGAIGGAAGVAGGIAGAAGGEAGQAVQTGAQVAQAGAQIIGGATGGGSPSTPSSQYIVDDDEASALLDGAAGAILGDGRAIDVNFHLEVQGFDCTWGVRHVDLHEQISGLYECVVRAYCSEPHPEVQELLGLEAHLQLDREEEMRSVRGIIKHASPQRYGQGSLVLLHIVPALWLLDQNMRSRVFTNKSVPEVVEEIFAERLSGRSRTINTEGLSRTYPTHELLTQFQETDLAFIQRRLEQEGIFFYFTHEGDHEELVLAEANASLATVRESDEGRVHWISGRQTDRRGEGVSSASHYEQIGAQDAIVVEYNWTTPDSPVRGEQTERGEPAQDPPLQVYDHTDAVTLHSYDGNAYPQSDAADQARIRSEILDLRRHRWTMSTLVVTAKPGHVIELVDCPNDELNGRYVIVSVDAEGSATEGRVGSYSNNLTVVPYDMPFRPARRTPIPIVSGYQSATVAGPTDQEIHTDEHGRVQVRFPWDPDHQPSEHDLCSCWIRVMHSWAGPGFGTTFVPRIGMEVVVSFLNGNPDKPLVVGCLYHGTNRSGVELDAKKTQSLIRTKSSPNSDGFNELRFEDEAGSEFIYTHAQKDYNEDVENDHSTHVKRNQSNTVDSDQTETVGNNQTMTVHGERTKTVDKDETNTVHQNRTTQIDKNDEETVGGDRTLHVEGFETVTIDKDRKLHVIKKTIQHHDDGREIKVKTADTLVVDEGANRGVRVTGEFNTEVTGAKYSVIQAGTEKFVQQSPKTYVESADEVHVKVGPSELVLKADGTVTVKTSSSILLGVGGSKLEITPSSVGIESNEIQLKAGESSVKLEASKATVKGANVDVLADLFTTIKGTLVRIN